MGKAEKGNPGRTPDDEIEDRIAVTVELLASGHRKSEIKKELAKRYKVTARTSENYLSRARSILLAEVADEREHQRARSLAFYWSILKDKATTTKDKLRAQHRIDKLLGLEAPQRISLTDSEGGDVPPSQNIQVNNIHLDGLSLEQLKTIREARQVIRQAAVAGVAVDGAVLSGAAVGN